MKYSVNAGSISSFVVAEENDHAPAMPVYMKEVKINTPLSYFVVGKFRAKDPICLMAVSCSEL